MGIEKKSNKAYHSGPGVSSSELKELLKSGAHYQTYKASSHEPTPEMIRGTLVHALLLEPETFENEFAVGEFNIRRGKEYDRLKSENPEKTVVSLEEVREAKQIAKTFQVEQQNNPKLAKLMEGVKELSFYWEDEKTGVLCKARPDIITPGGQVVDIKTSRDASFDSFQKQMIDLKYFLSAAYYLRGVQSVGVGALNCVIPTEFVFVVIETKEPYAVAIYRLDAKAIEIGNECVDKALDTYAEAVSTGVWSGYPKEVRTMDLPNWAMWKLNYILGGKK